MKSLTGNSPLLTRDNIKKRAYEIAKGRANTHGTDYEFWMYRMTKAAMYEALEMAGVNLNTIPEW